MTRNPYFLPFLSLFAGAVGVGFCSGLLAGASFLAIIFSLLSELIYETNVC